MMASLWRVAIQWSCAYQKEYLIDMYKLLSCAAQNVTVPAVSSNKYKFHPCLRSDADPANCKRTFEQEISSGHTRRNHRSWTKYKFRLVLNCYTNEFSSMRLRHSSSLARASFILRSFYKVRFEWSVVVLMTSSIAALASGNMWVCTGKGRLTSVTLERLSVDDLSSKQEQAIETQQASL